MRQNFIFDFPSRESVKDHIDAYLSEDEKDIEPVVLALQCWAYRAAHKENFIRALEDRNLDEPEGGSSIKTAKLHYLNALLHYAKKEKDVNKLYDLFAKAIEVNNLQDAIPEAQLGIGMTFQYCAKYASAMPYFKTAANNGNACAMVEIFGLWKLGAIVVGIPKVEKKTACDYILAAAKKGHPDAKYLVYSNELALEAERNEHLEQAALLGSLDAMKEIASIYYVNKTKPHLMVSHLEELSHRLDDFNYDFYKDALAAHKSYPIQGLLAVNLFWNRLINNEPLSDLIKDFLRNYKSEIVEKLKQCADLAVLERLNLESSLKTLLSEKRFGLGQPLWAQIEEHIKVLKTKLAHPSEIIAFG